LNRVVDWFNKNNNSDWIVKTAASRGTQNRFLSRNKILWVSEEDNDFSLLFKMQCDTRQIPSLRKFKPETMQFKEKLSSNLSSGMMYSLSFRPAVVNR